MSQGHTLAVSVSGRRHEEGKRSFASTTLGGANNVSAHVIHTGSRVSERFPFLVAQRGVMDSTLERALGDAHTVYFPAGSTVFRNGQVCQRYLIVSEGSIRVRKVSASGRELILYRVEPGQSCVLSTTCLLAGETYPAHGITETPVCATVIPKAQFEEALQYSPVFRRFVFTSFAKRISDFIMLLEEVAFARLDCRLAQHLLDRSTDDGVAICTHHTLAAEFGTAREVVSRLLKEFERNGLVMLRRGRILITNRQGLRQLTRCDSPDPGF